MTHVLTDTLTDTCSDTRAHSHADTQTHARSGEDAHGPHFSFVPASLPGALLSVSLVKGFHQIHRPLSASELPGRLVTFLPFLPAALLRGLPTPFLSGEKAGLPPTPGGGTGEQGGRECPDPRPVLFPTHASQVTRLLTS